VRAPSPNCESHKYVLFQMNFNFHLAAVDVVDFAAGGIAAGVAGVVVAGAALDVWLDEICFDCTMGFVHHVVAVVAPLAAVFAVVITPDNYRSPDCRAGPC